MKRLHLLSRKENINSRQYKLAFALALFLVLLDQLTKFLVRSSFFLGETKTLIPKALELAYVENTGIAFGLLKGMQPVMITIAIFVICAILFLLKNIKSRYVATSVGLILGGAIGNLIDRLIYGSITDFIKVSIWPVFNVADACVCIGAAMLAIYFMKKKD